MDRWTDRQRDRQTDGQTDGQTDRRDGWMDRGIDRGIDKNLVEFIILFLYCKSQNLYLNSTTYAQFVVLTSYYFLIVFQTGPHVACMLFHDIVFF